MFLHKHDCGFLKNMFKMLAALEVSNALRASRCIEGIGLCTEAGEDSTCTGV